MTGHEDELMRQALRGDKSAMEALLLAKGIEQKLVSMIVSWHAKGAAFSIRVSARKYYVKRGWLGVPKAARIQELMEEFGLTSNAAQNLADNRGSIGPIIREAARQLKAEAEADSH